ncbi:MAG: glycosyltransferase family 4 protein [Pseudomonadota bacterium]
MAIRRMSSVYEYVNASLRRDLKEFDHVIYQSSFSKDQADKHLFRRDYEFSIIHNGVDTSFLRPRKVAERSNHGIIMVLGSHHEDQLALALEVFRRVHSQFSDVELLIVGSMRQRSQSVESVVAEYRKACTLDGKVTCIGQVHYHSLPEIITQAHVLLHVKPGDCCPNAVIESMSCGVPVVSPMWGGTQEIIGDAGITVPGDRYRINDQLRDGMAEAVLKTLNDQQAFGGRARERALRYFDRRSIAEKYLSVMGLI